MGQMESDPGEALKFGIETAKLFLPLQPNVAAAAATLGNREPTYVAATLSGLRSVFLTS